MGADGAQHVVHIDCGEASAIGKCFISDGPHPAAQGNACDAVATSESTLADDLHIIAQGDSGKVIITHKCLIVYLCHL